MSDYISRADAIAYIDRVIKSGLGRYKSLNYIRKYISALPSADAVHGEWIKTTSGNGWNEWYVLKCPLCDATIEDKQNRKWEYNYCPNCGARMKGGDSE